MSPATALIRVPQRRAPGIGTSCAGERARRAARARGGDGPGVAFGGLDKAGDAGLRLGKKAGSICRGGKIRKLSMVRRESERGWEATHIPRTSWRLCWL